MNEKLLQYIWQFRYFNQANLCVESGETVQVIFPGQSNSNQGPDFLDARIRIGQTLWVGNIELHLKASDWYKHTHEEDSNYDNVILHVVLENDLSFQEEKIPLLVIGHRIPGLLIDKCEEWMQSQAFIPCAKSINQVSAIVWESWMGRLIMERMIRRAEEIRECLNCNHFHWEEVFWWQIAANFGIRVNASAFESLAKTIPVRLLARHKSQLNQLESLLFGQAGMLEKDFIDAYPLILKREFQFFRKKYHLSPIYQAIHFLRMRPFNFPTIRLSQLAALIHRSSHLFSMIKETEALQDVRAWLNVQANDYWNRHYRFDEISAFKVKSLGDQMIDNILINTVIPVLFAYGWINQDETIKERALDWLLMIPYEKISTVQQWKGLGVPCGNAYQSQALIELKSRYCDDRKCLACAIGNGLLKKYV